MNYGGSVKSRTDDTKTHQLARKLFCTSNISFVQWILLKVRIFTEPHPMPREVEPSLNEKQFLLRALEENLRIDGRAFDEARELELNLGDEPGTAEVPLGKTRSVI